ncbi:MAG: serine hydrolase domain-containing protein, partial [Balneolaceae bacterium]
GKLSRMERDEETGADADFPLRQNGTYFSGGAGLSGTASDYLRFMNAILNKGSLGEAGIVNMEMAEYFYENQIGDLRVGRDGFSYGFMITLPDGLLDFGRVPGRLSWGGLFQTSFWIDPQRDLTVVLLTQVFPSAHQDELYQAFERKVNTALQSVDSELLTPIN